MVNIPPKVTCKYTRLLLVAIFQQCLSVLIRISILCFVKEYIYFIRRIYCLCLESLNLYSFDLPFCRWSYGVLLYEIFTIGNTEWKFMRPCRCLLLFTIFNLTLYRDELD